MLPCRLTGCAARSSLLNHCTAKPGDSSSEDETSEEETESEEESSSEDEKPQKKTASKFQDEPVKSGPRKVISAKDKRFEEMKATVKTLKNAISINDWNAVVSGGFPLRARWPVPRQSTLEGWQPREG